MGEVFHPAKLKTKMQKVLVKEANPVIETIPDVYAWVNEEVLLREAYTHLEVVPAVFEKRVSRVMVTSPRCLVAPVPAVWTNATEKVDLLPEHQVWKLGEGIVRVPAQSVTRPVRKLHKPITSRVVDSPVEYHTITQEVMVATAQVRRVEMPALMGKVRVRKLVEPGKERVVVLPEEFEQMETQVVAAKSRTERVPVVCPKDQTPQRILALQTALKNAGYDPGKLNGLYHPKTKAAVNAYQLATGLGIGALSLDTLKRLGVP